MKREFVNSEEIHNAVPRQVKNFDSVDPVTVYSRDNFNNPWFATEAKCTMANLIQKYANEPVWAVVGASNDRAKFGNRIYRTLREAGYKVYAVNPREDEIEGDAAFKSIADLPEAPTVVDMVIPPRFALSTVEQAKAKGAKAIWFQPGSEDPTAIQWAKDNGLDVVESCILVHHVQNPGGATAR